MEPYHIRVDAALWMRHEKAQEYLEAFENALKAQPFSINGCSARARTILGSPAKLREPLMPLARMLMRKVSEKRGSLTGDCRHEQTTDAYTLSGVGADIWDTIDDFHFACKSLHGDGSIAARIDSIENANEWAKTGVMIRSTSEPGSPNVMLLVTPSGRLSFQYRLTSAGPTYGLYTPPGHIELPHWVRLTRQGNHFTARQSSDGVTWEDVLEASSQPANIEIPMDGTVYIGLAVTSHDVTRTAETRISHVTTTGDVSPSGPFTLSQDINFQTLSIPND